MFRTPPRGAHRAPGRAVVDYRALAAPVGRSVSGAAVLGAVTAGVAIAGVGAANAQAPGSPQPRTVTPPSLAPQALATASAVSPAAPIVPPTAVTLRSGARGNAVASLQQALNVHGASLAVDGSFGPATLQAVRSFQRGSGLVVDGVAGPKTWAALGGSPVSGSTGSTGSSSSSQPKLRQGDRSAAVTTLQNLLRDRGASIVADGKFGPATQRAVLSFQRSAGLSADGVVGPKTWSALASGKGSAAGSSGSSSSSSSSGSSSDVSGSAIVASAKAQLGVKYVWGGSSPSKGFDCSGLTSYAYKQNGVTLPRTARAQALGGRIISQSEARPGDLVAFTADNYGHVAIYAGDGKIVDASGSQGKVVYRSIWNSPHVFVSYR